ncbi:hypothetical protein HPB52_001889 [Rhipicephalus sanguineus]|uniref:Uncharacterized protein n=1 Tax=Rhipicephalus sanguineus TaxID=34632 RepID=A0A9D4QCW8_RHISA|nr:hypothetical protein HPB52_001889 [Rhipicephalus sanguineus]
MRSPKAPASPKVSKLPVLEKHSKEPPKPPKGQISCTLLMACVGVSIGLTGCPGGAAKTVLKSAPYDKFFGFE